jgi:hypothetical protein
MSSDIIFSIVAKGKERKADLLHLLNDLRNLKFKVYVLTDLDIDFKYYLFNNVTIVKDTNTWSCFDRYKITNHVFDVTDTSYVYNIDCDCRFTDYRNIPYNRYKFIDLLDSINFDILFSWDLGEPTGPEWHLRSVDEDEYRPIPPIRYYNYGFDSVIEFLKQDLPNYKQSLKETSPACPLESVLIFRRSNQVQNFILNLQKLGDMILVEHKKCGRISGPVSSFAMALYVDKYNINMLQSPIVCHHFWSNFLNEIPLWGSWTEKEFSIYT